MGFSTSGSRIVIQHKKESVDRPTDFIDRFDRVGQFSGDAPSSADPTIRSLDELAEVLRTAPLGFQLQPPVMLHLDQLQVKSLLFFFVFFFTLYCPNFHFLAFFNIFWTGILYFFEDEPCTYSQFLFTYFFIFYKQKYISLEDEFFCLGSKGFKRVIFVERISYSWGELFKH